MQAGRLRWMIDGTVGLLLLSLAACGGSTAPPPPPVTVKVDPTGAQQALDGLADAVRAGRTGDPGLAGTLETNAKVLRVTGFTARYLTDESAAAPDGAWTGDVEVTWRFDGFDARSIDETVAVTFAPQAGRVALTAVGGLGHRTPLWLTGPLQVRRADGILVLVSGSSATADRYLLMARRALAAVRRVVPWPHPDLVLEVPASQAALERDLAAGDGSYAGVAAVTATVDGSDASGTPVHIFVNPDGIGDLHDPGAQVVLSHEATHDATRVVPNSTLPKWLLEGFADYVALRDVTLPFSVTAKELRADVRKHGAPAHLPADSDFNSAAEDFGEEYEQAWTACRTIALIGGERALVTVYDAVRGGAPLDATLRKEIGVGVAGLTKRWRQQLVVWSR